MKAIKIKAFINAPLFCADPCYIVRSLITGSRTGVTMFAQQAVIVRSIIKNNQSFTRQVFLTTLLLNLVLGSNVAFSDTYDPVGIGIAGAIHALAYDPDDPHIVYAGGDMCGVFRSIDGGLHWELDNVGLTDSGRGNSRYVDDLIVISPNCGVSLSRCGVYAATQGGIYFKSVNATSWVSLTPANSYSFYGSNNALTTVVSAEPIPYSCFSYSQHDKILYAGAGHGNWSQDDIYSGYLTYNNFAPFGDSPSSQYSLWKLDLDTPNSSWTPILDTVRRQTN